MLEINLLPWRVTAKKKIKRYQLFCTLSVMIILILLYLTYFHAQNKISVPIVMDKPDVHWKGYLSNEKEFLGLIALGKGPVFVVKRGMHLNAMYVVGLYKNGILIDTNGKKEFFGNAI